MQTYREQTEIYKLKRAGIVEPKRMGSKNKRPRPWILFVRMPQSGFADFREWHKDYRAGYRTEEEANAAVRSLKHKHPTWEYRVESQEKT